MMWTMMGCRSYSALLLGLLTACSGSPNEVDAGNGDEEDSSSDDDDDDDDDDDESSSGSSDDDDETGISTTSGTSTTGGTTSTTSTSGDPSTTSTSSDSTSSTTGTIDTCQEGTATCSTANQVERCENGELVEEPCPNGTNCEGGTCTPVTCANNLPAYDNGSGAVTVYWFAQGTLTDPNNPEQDVHCSYGSTRNFNTNDNGNEDQVYNITDGRLFGAIATADYRNSAACGSCVDLFYNGNTVRITIADECPIGTNPTCTNGHIDLSRQAFQTLTGQSTNDIGGVNWNVVPCGFSEPISIKLREPDNVYYKAFVVMKHEYPIERAQYLSEDGSWVDATRDPANFFYSDVPNGDLTYRVRVYDVNGGIIEQELQPGVADPQVGTHQFACQ